MASDDEENSYNEEEFERLEGNSGIIFLIDSRKSMFTKDVEDDENNQITRFNLALACCRSQILNKIIGKQKCVVGIVLFGTKKSEDNSKHVSLLLELNHPEASAVKQLDELLKDPNSEEVQSEYGSSDDFLLADALWFCSSLLSKSRVQLAEKKIMLFTDDCNPHSDHADCAHMARQRAKNLNEVNTTLEIIPIGNTDFNYDVFYKELVDIVRGHPDPDEIYPDLSSRLQDLLERVNRVDYRRRRYAKIKWNLGNDVVVGVSLYTLYREAKVSPAQTLSRATNEPVAKSKQTYNEATGELLLPSDIVQYLSIAGTDVIFNREEKDTLNEIMEPGMMLLGFKPLSVVNEGQHCGLPAFVFPEDSLIKGSRKLVKALVHRCIAKQKVAVCCMTPRHRAVTRYYFLVPSEESYDDNGCQLSLCGFHAIPIPFDSDTREQQFEYSSEINHLTLDLVKKVVNKLKITYKPSDFQNPKLQLLLEHLTALALDYPAPSGVEDQTAPDELAQTARLGSLVEQFNNAFDLEGHPATVNKRERQSGSFTGAPKRPRRNDDINIDVDIRAAIKAKKVDKFTVAQLKEFCNMNDIRVTDLKKKADFVNAIYNMNI